jgi:replicative DNA helicase
VTAQVVELPQQRQPEPEHGSGGQFDRTLPQDIPAEQAVLGGMMLSKDACAEVFEILRGDDFYRPAHATVFDTIVRLYGQGAPIDMVSVGSALLESGDLGKVGGGPYLHTLVQSVPTAANAAWYARSVYDRAVERRLIEAGTRLVQLGHSGARGTGRSASDLATLAQQAVYEVTARQASDDYSMLADMLQPTLDEIEAVGARGGEMTGVPTGFTDLDRLLNGLSPGQLIIVAGRPGMGKSTLAVDVIRNVAIRANQTAAMFSLEMSKVELVMRILSAEARVPLHVLRSGQLADDDWTKLARCMGEIAEAPLVVDDTPSMNLMQIRAKAQRLKQRHDLKLIAVDYLQLMSTPRGSGRSREQEVAELSRGLKLLGKELEVPVIAVSQLNRGPEQRSDKRPQLSDLRESGSLEQDADVVILMHRDDYYDPESPRGGEADVIVAKQRNGPTDTVTVAAQLHLSRFVDMAIV